MTGKYLQHWKDETVTGFSRTLISVSFICFSSSSYFSLSFSLVRLFNKNPIANLVGLAEGSLKRLHNMDLFRNWNNHHRNKTARLKQTNELSHFHLATLERNISEDMFVNDYSLEGIHP